MTAPAASPRDPVDVYYESLERLHRKVRKNTPFTYIAYKSMFPAEEDDFIGMAYKISYYITFKFFIHIGSHLTSPFFHLIPICPLVLDLLWVGYRKLWEEKVSLAPSERCSPLTTVFFLALGLAAIHYLDKFPEF